MLKPVLLVREFRPDRFAITRPEKTPLPRLSPSLA